MNKEFKVTVNGKIYQVIVEECDTHSDVNTIQPVTVQAPVASVPETVKEEVKTVETKNTSNINATKVTAPMPGAVWKILKKPGETVKKHEPVLILEVMKMENEIVAPNDGEIVSFSVKETDKVNAGQLLFEVNC